MLWILIAFLSPGFAQADSRLQVPEAVRAKWSEVTKTVTDGYENAKAKVDEAGREELGIELKKNARAAGRFWWLAKQKGHGILVFLDNKFHEKVLELEPGERKQTPGRK